VFYRINDASRATVERRRADFLFKKALQTVAKLDVAAKIERVAKRFVRNFETRKIPKPGLKRVFRAANQQNVGRGSAVAT
jgi:hypothetical protein